MASIAGAIAGIAGTVLGFISTSTILPATGSPGQAYRPEVWGNGPPDVMISIPGLTYSVGESQTTSDGTSVAGVAGSNTQTDPPINYVFDGYPRVEHNITSVATRIPTQTGAAITDHMYSEPRRLTLEIVVSDALDSYLPGQFAGGSTKSIGAFQVLKQIRDEQTACTITTRIDTYQNMVLLDLHVVDDSMTRNGLRAIASFQEIIFGQVSTQALTQRTDATQTQSMGQTSVSTTSQNLEQQHNVTLPGSRVTQSTIPGAGSYSSNVIGS